MDILLAFLTLTCLHYWWKAFQMWYFWYRAVRDCKHFIMQSKDGKDGD